MYGTETKGQVRVWTLFAVAAIKAGSPDKNKNGSPFGHY
jgi:hypothetical protein